MLGTIPLAEALALSTPDADDLDGCHTARDLTGIKRRSPHYQELLDSIHRHGITTPVVIRTSPDGRYLADGHHRLTAAVDVGLTHIPWTDDWLLAHSIDTMPWRLAPGVLTPAAVEAFTRGACAGLAVALHDATGWPLVEVGHCDGLPLHFMVRCPDGRLVDVQAAHTDADVRDEWEFDTDEEEVVLASVARQAVVDCYRDDCGEPVPMDLVRTFVAPVLALTGLKES
ncbi:ParB/RepB/Spo0J family partition protein [Streptomyces sp. NPDC057596]|uniref:ParB/RepB/Spo0J family partition protein n=1 Tax=Streptomyces sp. NPDC057596 TaxID=3346178 RepID=UPI0036CF796C